METIEKPTTINSDSAPVSEKTDKRVLSIEEQKMKSIKNICQVYQVIKK
jgi:hypothetical protein